MLKVLVAALIGTAAGVAVMIIVIVASGTTTSDASSVGLGSLPITTATPSAPATTAPATTGGGTTGGSSGGDATAGKAIFTGSAGCSGCHTLAPAGATGTVGPNLDNISADQKASGVPLDQFIEESITDPDKYIAKGFSQGVMPTTFGTSLSQSQVADLVALISQAQSSS